MGRWGTVHAAQPVAGEEGAETGLAVLPGESRACWGLILRAGAEL